MKKKERREKTLCNGCRRSQLICNEDNPCNQCTLTGAQCIYSPAKTSNKNQLKKSKKESSSQRGVQLLNQLTSLDLFSKASETPGEYLYNAVKEEPSFFERFFKQDHNNLSRQEGTASRESTAEYGPPLQFASPLSSPLPSHQILPPFPLLAPLPPFPLSTHPFPSTQPSPSLVLPPPLLLPTLPAPHLHSLSVQFSPPLSLPSYSSLSLSLDTLSTQTTNNKPLNQSGPKSKENLTEKKGKSKRLKAPNQLTLEKAKKGIILSQPTPSSSIISLEISSKYYDMLNNFFFKLSSKTTNDFLHFLSSKEGTASFEEKFSSLSIVTKVVDDRLLSDHYFQHAIEESETHLLNLSSDPRSRYDLAISLCSLSSTFAGLNQRKFRLYSSIGRGVAERILKESEDERESLLLVIVLLTTGIFKKPQRLLILEYIAEEKHKLMKEEKEGKEGDKEIQIKKERVKEYEDKMLQSEVYSFPKGSRSEYKEIWREIHFLQCLYFVRRCLFSYCQSLWNVFHQEVIDIHDGEISHGCLPLEVGKYLLDFIRQAEINKELTTKNYSKKGEGKENEQEKEKHQNKPSGLLCGDIDNSFIQFFVFKGIEKDPNILDELGRRCLDYAISLQKSGVDYPGVGLIPSLYVVARHFAFAKQRKPFEKVSWLITLWSSGLSHCQKFVMLLHELKETVL